MGLVLFVALLAVGCGKPQASSVVTGPDPELTNDNEVEAGTTEQVTVAPPMAEAPSPSVPSTQATTLYEPPAMSNDYTDEGVTTLEERILRADVIVRARVRSKTASSRWRNKRTRTSPIYLSYVDFTFDVLETLKGSVGDTVVVELKAVGRFDYEVESGWSESAAEAERRAAEWMSNEYDSQWESRDAILFLVNISNTSEYTRITTKGRPSNVQFAFVGDDLGGTPASHVNGHDYFSISSANNKVWLPATTTASGAGMFYLEEPSEADGTVAGDSEGGDSDITLAALRTTIKTETDAIDSSIPGHKECLVVKKWDKRLGRSGTTGSGSYDIDSGSLAGTVVYERIIGASVYWSYILFGEDASLFETEESDDDTDPVNGFDRLLKTIRPLPQGQYIIEEAKQQDSMVPCGYIPDERIRWAINVVAPEGTLHELFFDPVTDGTAVAADSANGVLKPASFTDTNNASASLQRIEWASGTVKMKLSPHTGLTGQTVDFIELDGSVSLSLDVADATVDAANNTLSWSVSSQLWHDGDKLMLRIRKS